MEYARGRLVTTSRVQYEAQIMLRHKKGRLEAAPSYLFLIKP